MPVSIATVLPSFINRDSMTWLPKKKATKKGTVIINASFTAAPKPAFTLPCFPAPRFCAVKLLVPFPSVVRLVMAKVFSLIAAE